MLTFVCTIISRSDRAADEVTLIITPPVTMGHHGESVVTQVLLSSLDLCAGDAPSMSLGAFKFEIGRRWEVGACLGNRVVFQPTDHGILVTEIDFDGEV